MARGDHPMRTPVYGGLRVALARSSWSDVDDAEGAAQKFAFRG